MIDKCVCTSAFQDKEHGKGNRVFTEGVKGKSGNAKRKCTVCGTVKQS